jgi:hypothetical protein
MAPELPPIFADCQALCILVLCTLLQAQTFWHRIRQMQENDVPVYVTVTAATRGGLLVQYNHLEGFIPASHLGQVGRFELHSLSFNSTSRAVLQSNCGLCFWLHDWATEFYVGWCICCKLKPTMFCLHRRACL